MLKRKVLIVLLAAVVACVMFFACSKDELGGSNNKSIPDKPPVVNPDKDGELTKGKGDGYDNAAVTKDNLEDFIHAYRRAIDSDYNSNSSYSSQRGKRTLPNEYEKGEGSVKWTFTRYGDDFGRAEVDEKYSASGDWKKTGDIESGSGYEGGSGTVKYFDFSNSGQLFLGGAVGYVGDWSATYKDSIRSQVLKVNGTINFAGAFKGKVVFDNVEFLYQHKPVIEEYCYDDGNCYVNWIDEDTLFYGIKSGSFYVKSEGKEKVDLPKELFREYFWFPYSRKDDDDGNSNITIKMPSVPSAPNGALSSHAGNNITASDENVNAFFKAFVDEFYDRGNYPRSGDSKDNWEGLRHGKVSGYYLYKENSTSQYNNSGDYSSMTETTEYGDYSNKGVLYFGGGWAKANVSFYKYTNTSNSSTEKDTTIINGKVKFNGEFKGELNFENFKYAYEYSYSDGNSTNDYRRIGGSVKIGTLDVTDKYVKYVLKKESIPNSPPPNPSLDQKVVGNWLIYEEDGYMLFLIFNSDGSGSTYEYDEYYGAYEDEFSWDSENGFLYIVWWDGDEEVYEYLVSGSTLTITGEYDSYTCSKYNGTLPRGLRSVRGVSVNTRGHSIKLGVRR